MRPIMRKALITPLRTREESASAIPAYDGPEAGLPSEYEAPKKLANCTIGYQNISGAISSLAAEQEAAEEEAKALGCKIVALDDQLNPTTQVNNFEQLLTQKVSAIVVYPIVPSALALVMLILQLLAGLFFLPIHRP